MRRGLRAPRIATASSHARPGTLPSTNPAERRVEPSRSRSRTGTKAHLLALASSTCAALRRSTRGARSWMAPARRRPYPAAATCSTTARGATTTRWPARRARQPKSTSSRNRSIWGSRPPSSSQMSRRTSMPAVPTARTSRRSSCWPWSYSSCSRPMARRPDPVMLTPSSTRRRWPSQSSALAPTTGASCSTALLSSQRRAYGSGALSSWISQSHSAAGWADDPSVRGTWAAAAATASG